MRAGGDDGDRSPREDGVRHLRGVRQLLDPVPGRRALRHRRHSAAARPSTSAHG